MPPEMPFIAATLIAIVTGVRREGGFPTNGIKALIAMSILVIVASMTADTKAALLVRAIGMALLLTSILGFGRTLNLSSNTGGRAASGGTPTVKEPK